MNINLRLLVVTIISITMSATANAASASTTVHKTFIDEIESQGQVAMSTPPTVGSPRDYQLQAFRNSPLFCEFYPAGDASLLEGEEADEILSTRSDAYAITYLGEEEVLWNRERNITRTPGVSPTSMLSWLQSKVTGDVFNFKANVIQGLVSHATRGTYLGWMVIDQGMGDNKASTTPTSRLDCPQTWKLGGMDISMNPSLMISSWQVKSASFACSIYSEAYYAVGFNVSAVNLDSPNGEVASATRKKVLSLLSVARASEPDDESKDLKNVQTSLTGEKLLELHAALKTLNPKQNFLDRVLLRFSPQPF